MATTQTQPQTQSPRALDIDASRLSAEMRTLEAKLVMYLMTPTPAGGRGLTLNQVAAHFHFTDACQRLYHIGNMSPRSVSADLLHAVAWEQTFRELYNLSPEGRAYLGNVSFEALIEYLQRQRGSPPSVCYAEFHYGKTEHRRCITESVDEIYQELIRGAEEKQRLKAEHCQAEQEEITDHVQHAGAGAKVKKEVNHVNVELYPNDQGRGKGKGKEKEEVDGNHVRIDREVIGPYLEELWNSVIPHSEVNRVGGYTKMDIVRLIVGIWEVGDVVSRQDGTRLPLGFGGSAKDWCETKTEFRYDEVVGRPRYDVSGMGAWLFGVHGSDEMRD